MILERDTTDDLPSVVCLFCGLPMSLPHMTRARRSGEGAETPESLVALLRCRVCGKEAPYCRTQIGNYRTAA